MTALPAELTYGKVVGRFIFAAADAPTDPDVLPDAVPAQGTVTLTPLNPHIKTTSPRPTLVVKRPLTYSLDAEGYLTDENGLDGVWVVTGAYTVAYTLPGATLASHTIDVLATHTEETPLDLTTALPPGGPILNATEYAELSARMSALELKEGPPGPAGSSPPSVFSDTAKWRSPYVAANAHSSGTNGHMILVRASFDEPVEIDGIGIELSGTNTADGEIHLAIYDNSPTDYMPQNLLHTEVLTAPTNGKHAFLFNPIALPSSVYWIGYVPVGRTSTNIQISGTPTAMWAANDMGSGTSPSTATGNTGYVAEKTGVTTAPPAVFDGRLAQHSNVPRRAPMVWLRTRRTT